MWKCRKEKVKISGEPGPGYVVCNKDQSVSQKGRWHQYRSPPPTLFTSPSKHFLPKVLIFSLFPALPMLITLLVLVLMRGQISTVGKVCHFSRCSHLLCSSCSGTSYNSKCAWKWDFGRPNPKTPTNKNANTPLKWWMRHFWMRNKQILNFAHF